MKPTWIYELVDDRGKCTYIGKTVNPTMRETHHRQDKGKLFTEMRLISFFLTEDEALHQEAILIQRLRPVYNRQGNPSYSRASANWHREGLEVDWMPDSIAPSDIPTLPSEVDATEYAKMRDDVYAAQREKYKEETDAIARAAKNKEAAARKAAAERMKYLVPIWRRRREIQRKADHLQRKFALAMGFSL